jgi:phosphatidylglycerol:prolipoprotein diacylglycerol transferase
MALGFIGGLLNWMWLGRRRGYDAQFCSDLMFWVMISGILGARIAYVMENWSDYAGNPLSVIRIDQGGLVFFGGFVASGIAVVVFSAIKKIRLLPLLDFVITSVPLAHALGRIGCFLNGCCFGSCTTMPVGVRFPKGSLPWIEHYSEHLIDKTADLSCRVHPVQLYESAYNFMLYIFLVLVFSRTKRTGLVSALYLVFYPLGRFVLEFFRGDRPERVAVGGLSIGQFISIPLFLVGIILLLWLMLKGRQNEDA